MSFQHIHANGTVTLYHEGMQAVLDTIDYPSSCQGPVYSVVGFDSSECGAMSYHYAFRQSAAVSDCFEYEAEDASFLLRCIGTSSEYFSFDNRQCQGNAIANGTLPWSWYTTSECMSFQHIHANGTVTLYHEGMQAVLDTIDYPSSCQGSSSTSTSPSAQFVSRGRFGDSSAAWRRQGQSCSRAPSARAV